MFAKLIENIQIALTALGSNKMRTFLTMLGITIGVGSVILLTSVGDAVEKFVIHEFSQFGSNIVIVMGKANNEVFDQLTASEMEMFAPLTQTDLDALSSPFNVPDAAVVGAEIGVEDAVYYNGETYHPTVGGMTANYLDVYNFDIGVGERFTQAHMDSAARVALLGIDVVEDMFDNEYPIGKHIRVGDVQMEVIGVFDDLNTSLSPEANNFIILPITTVQRRIIGERTVDGDYPVLAISVKAIDPSAVDAVAEQVRATLRETHDIKPGDDDDFVIFSMNQLLDTLDTITSLMTVFLGVIASISLIVGGIGIMNIMLVTVTERTREIGIRKAVGAQRHDILVQFLIESSALSLTGGTVGTLLAVSGCVLVTALVPNLDVIVSVENVVLAAGISIAVGLFFGIYPANRAANLNPIDALHYE